MIEEWKDIKGYEGMYQVSNLGGVKSLERYVPNGPHTCRIVEEKYLSTSTKMNRYVKVGLRGNCQRVHRLVANAFLSNPNNYPEVNHINGIKSDNRVTNLEWCTSQHNAIHKEIIGSMPIGNSHVNSKITEEIAREIKRLLLKGERQVDIAKKFGINDGIVYYINKGTTWRRVTI